MPVCFHVFFFTYSSWKVNRVKRVSKWTVGEQVSKREQLEFRDAPGISRVWRMNSCPHIRELDLDSTLWSPDSRDWIPDSFSVKLGFRILSLVGLRILDLDSALHMVKFPRFQIPEAKVSPIRGARRWCYTVRFATTIFSATQCCNIVWNIYNIVPTLQRCVALKIVVANRTV